MPARSTFASSIIRNFVTLGAACAFAFAGAACAAQSTDSGDSSEAAADEQAHVRGDGAGVRVQIGADEVAASQTEGGREVRYYEAGAWVGTVSFSAGDRVLTVSAPGFERTVALDDDLAAQSSSLGVLLGLGEEEQANYLGGILKIDARLASNASVPRAIASYSAGKTTSGAIRPQMLGVCTSVAKGTACGILTLGLCGYVMIFDCLVLN